MEDKELLEQLIMLYGYYLDLPEEYLEKLDLKTGKIVATNEECGKVIDNFKCYIVTITDSEEARSAKVGDSIKVRLSNNVEVKAEITNISNENEEKRILILGTEEFMFPGIFLGNYLEQNSKKPIVEEEQDYPSCREEDNCIPRGGACYCKLAPS